MAETEMLTRDNHTWKQPCVLCVDAYWDLLNLCTVLIFYKCQCGDQRMKTYFQCDNDDLKIE